MTPRQLTFLREDSLARTSPLLDAALDWAENGPASSLSSLALLRSYDLVGSSSKTSLGFSHRTKEGTWESSFTRWANSGIGGPTACLTLNTSEFPSDAVACSLSDVLEPGESIQEKFFLSETACGGILRRAEKRKKRLPGSFGGSAQSGGFRTTDLDGQGAFVVETAKALSSRPHLALREDADTLAVETLRSVGAGAGSSAGNTPIVHVPEVVGALSDGAHHGGGLNGQDVYTGRIFAQAPGRPRRLTPVECERLQGFPDGWTEWGVTSKFPVWMRGPREDWRVKAMADSHRYRQLGNAVAVPVAEWIAKRIVAAHEGRLT